MAARLAAAAAGTGIGLTLLPVFYAHGGFGGQPASAAQRRFLHSPDSFARLTAASRAALAGLPDAVVGIAPHSLRAVKPDELAEILPLAEDGPVHIHIAEQMREVEDCLAWSGARPVRWLLDHAPVDRRWCLVHATHVDAGELADMARSGAVAGCARSRKRIWATAFSRRARSSMPAAPSGWDRIQRPHRSGRGTAAAGIWPAPRRAGAQHAGRAGSFDWTEPVAARGRGGAQALGVPGGLAVGASADLVVLRDDGDLALARSGDAMLDTFVFAGGRRDIADVWRAGDRVVIDGRHRDHAVIEARYRRVVKGLLEA
jgi:cytosine/adenosine deaminase-related metal-dependent hydrolase